MKCFSTAVLCASLSSAAAAEPIRMTPAEVEAALRQNEVVIQQRIKSAGGVIVTGRVDGIETVDGRPVIRMRSSNPFISVRAYPSAREDFASGLRSGQTVTLFCDRTSLLAGAALYDCALYVPAASPERPRSMIPAATSGVA